MPPIAQWTTPQIGPLGGKQPPTQARIKAIPMPEMATGTPWFPVMAQSMSGQTALTLTGGGGQGQSLPPAIGSSSHGGRARNGKASRGKARDGKIGIGNHASNGTTNARNGKTGAQVVPQAHGEDGQPQPPQTLTDICTGGLGLTKGGRKGGSSKDRARRSLLSSNLSKSA